MGDGADAASLAFLCSNGGEPGNSNKKVRVGNEEQPMKHYTSVYTGYMSGAAVIGARVLCCEAKSVKCFLLGVAQLAGVEGAASLVIGNDGRCVWERGAGFGQMCQSRLDSFV